MLFSNLIACYNCLIALFFCTRLSLKESEARVIGGILQLMTCGLTTALVHQKVGLFTLSFSDC